MYDNNYILYTVLNPIMYKAISGHQKHNNYVTLYMMGIKIRLKGEPRHPPRPSPYSYPRPPPHKDGPGTRQPISGKKDFNF